VDHATIGQMVAGPGMDTRLWISYGLVDADTDEGRSVRFTDEETGDPLPHGVLINVTLQPSGLSVPCRVGSMTAGSGEGEYSPFGPGDEVLVAIPDGDERAGCVIVARLSNAKDVFPTTVAGMGVTNNDTTFRRLKTPYVLETAASYVVRQASTGASFSIDPAGEVKIGGADGHMLTLGADVLAFQDAKQQAGVQVDVGEVKATLMGGATSFSVSDEGATLLTPGVFKVGSSGLPAAGHAVTVEQVLCMFGNFLCALCLQSAFPSGQFSAATWVIPGTAVGVLQSIYAAMIQGCVTPAPMGTAGAPGGEMTALGVSQLVMAALQAQAPDPAALGLPAPVLPGLGRAGLMF
jgi:hypothetical protein